MLILLDGHSLTPKIGLNPDTWAPAIQERDGSGSFTLGPDEPEVIVGEWILDGYTPQAGMVWRIRSIETDFNTGKRTVQTEHLITSLKDISLFGEVTPEDMGGGSTVSAATAAAYILSKQSDWMLGTFGYQMSAPFSFNGDSLFDALETITSAQEAACWTYSFASYPFTINIVPKSSSVACELREGRNLNTIRKSIDRSQMFTRIYPIGKDNLHISGDYVSKNENTYGRKDTVRTDGSIGDATLLRAWASDILDNHCEPLVTITVAGLELSAATGEDLDKLVVGTRCQIPLPEYGTTITERITKVQWRDKVAAPEDVTITLANNQQDVARIINQISKSAGKAGRAGAKQAEEDHAWIEDTTDHVMLIAEKTFGKDAQTGKVDWSRVSRLEVGQDGIWGEVKVTEGDIVTAVSRIDQNENAITAEVTARENADTQTAGKLIVQSDMVGLTVSITDQREVLSFPSYYRFPATGSSSYVYLDVGTGYYYKWENNEYVRTTYSKVINAGGIVTSINEDNTISTRISSDKVYIGNEKSTTVINGKCTLADVTADYIAAKIATLSALGVVRVNANSVYIKDTNNLDVNVSGGFHGAYISLSNNTYTLHLLKMDGTYYSPPSGYSLDFSRATTLSGAWSSGKLTVSASPQGETFERTLSAGTTSWSGNQATVPINATWGNSGQYSESTGKNIYVDASARYTAGGTAAGVTGSWSGATYTVTRAADTSTKSLSCTVTISPSQATTLSYGQSVTVYARGNTIDKASVTITAPSAPAHRITEFDTTAPPNASYDGNTNNSDGYYISGSNRGATVGSVIYGSWKCDGNSKSGYNYITGAPTAIYKKGWDNAAGKMGWPPTITGTTVKTSADITYPTTNGTTTRTLSVSVSNGHAYVSLGGNLVLYK